MTGAYEGAGKADRGTECKAERSTDTGTNQGTGKADHNTDCEADSGAE